MRLASNGVHVSGCTVHRVDEGMDTGAILRSTPRSRLPRRRSETSLAAAGGDRLNTSSIRRLSMLLSRQNDDSSRGELKFSISPVKFSEIQ